MTVPGVGKQTIHPDKRGDSLDFEMIYKKVRKAEQRWYTDEQVKNLPEISLSHPHSGEWQLRKRTSTAVIKYLNKKGRALKILEVGCGNGWLSAKLAVNNSFTVVGADINNEELDQAKRVFGNISNLEFISGNIPIGQLNGGSFDIILFASSIQYFPSIKEIIEKALHILDEDGEIHIMDTVFYDKSGIENARQRTRDYYTQMGLPDAASCYHHHCIDDLKSFNSKILYKPGSWMSYFNKYRLPFYWIRIKKGRAYS